MAASSSAMASGVAGSSSQAYKEPGCFQFCYTGAVVLELVEKGVPLNEHECLGFFHHVFFYVNLKF